MKIAISGHRGPVGQELLKFPNTLPLDADVRSPQEIEMVIESERPDLVLHLASISSVDECEKPENEKKVIETNLRGTFHMASVCEKYECNVVLLSTDHVFDGIWGNYKESSRPSPNNFYGHSKMTAEGLRSTFSNLKVVRTSRIFSSTSLSTDMGKLVAGEVQEYPAFIYRSFMWLPHFALSLIEYSRRYEEMPSVLHISGSKSVSYFTFMKDLAKVFEIDGRLVMPRATELQGCTPRPFKAGLNTALSKRLGFTQYDYTMGLEAMRFLG